MICRNYRPVYVKEVTEGEETKIYNVIDVELVADTTPNPLPTKPTGIDGFPKSYDPDRVIFAGGSVLLVADSGDLYVAKEQGVFVNVYQEE